MSNMYKILVEDIENKGEIKTEFNEIISEISEKPIVAELNFKSIGDFIEVKGKAKGSTVFECDLCLEEFNYDFDIKIDEIFAKHQLHEEYGEETELKEGQFITDLNGENEIDIYDLLYQSVILQLPNKKVCGINCNEGKFAQDVEQDTQDERMAIFKTIKIEK